MNAIEISEEDKALVRKYYNVTEEDMKRDVRIIQEWLKKQPHLPPIPDDDLIERVLIRTKCRVEKAKSGIDSYFTAKTIWPELYQDLHKIVPSKAPLCFVAMDKLTADKELVLIGQIRAPPEKFDLLEATRVVTTVAELYLRCDYTLGFHAVVDFTTTEAGHLKKLALVNLLQKIFSILFQVYSTRAIGLYFYKPPTWISILLDILKTFLPKKIVLRIHLVKDNDSLLKLLPKECLPAEYGGTNKSMDELIKITDKLFESNKKLLEEVPKIKSNEKLRIGNSNFETNMFGIDGTFKKLNID